MTAIIKKKNVFYYCFSSATKTITKTTTTTTTTTTTRCCFIKKLLSIQLLLTFLLLLLVVSIIQDFVTGAIPTTTATTTTTTTTTGTSVISISSSRKTKLNAVQQLAFISTRPKRQQKQIQQQRQRKDETFYLKDTIQSSGVDGNTYYQKNDNNNNNNINHDSSMVVDTTATIATATTTNTVASTSSTAASKKSAGSTNSTSTKKQPKSSGFAHTMAILTFPKTAMDRIANECILERSIASVSSLVYDSSLDKMVPGKLSVVLKCQDSQAHRTPLWELCQMINDLYSHSWDIAIEKMELDLLHYQNMQERGELSQEVSKLPLLDICIYPQGLPNAAPEGWIYQTSKDLDCICSSNSFMGWHSSSSSSRSTAGKFSSSSSSDYTSKEGAGLGGLQSHVDAVNVERQYRNLKPVVALEVQLPDCGTKHSDVIFLEDERPTSTTAKTPKLTRNKRNKEELYNNNNNNNNTTTTLKDDPTSSSITSKNEQDDVYDFENPSLGLLGGFKLESNLLYTNVCVGGTFDSMHYGHRKLLTLAVASVDPRIGKLSIGVTSDQMLTHKSFSNLIPPLSERVLGVKEFLDRLAPGLKNRRKIISIQDEMGPTATDETLDALVLSHETLKNGHMLNSYRQSKGWNKLKLLCTRRTEQHSMSSTALRKRLKEFTTTTSSKVVVKEEEEEE